MEPERKEFSNKCAKLRTNYVTEVARQLTAYIGRLIALTDPQLAKKLPNQEFEYRVHQSAARDSIPIL